MKVFYICAECGSMGISEIDKAEDILCEYCHGDSAEFIELKDADKTSIQLEKAAAAVRRWQMLNLALGEEEKE